MTNLDSILKRKLFPRVRKPGRYTGGELNAIQPDNQSLQIALAFPDLYEIAFSYYGFQILYHILNRMESVNCQRVYALAEDAEKILRDENIPLFTLEGKLPLHELDILGFTLQYELHAPDIINMLELGNIPVHSIRRGSDDPFVIAGGPLTYNPEPFAPFFDAFIIGDAEITLPEFVRTLSAVKRQNLTRNDTLRQFARLPGVYVPALYSWDNSTQSPIPDDSENPVDIKAVHVENLLPESYPEKPLIPLIAVEHDRLTVEIMRGCSRGCRFCNAGMNHRPTREIPPGQIEVYLQRTLANTGYEEVSLLSLSTADYSALNELLVRLDNLIDDPGISLSYPSLRPDAFTPEMAASIAGGRKSTLTFAPETGSEKLRAVVNKDIRDQDIFNALQIARTAGWRSAKLYFMLGLPFENDDDLQALVDLARKCAKLIVSGKKRPLHISVAVFSPKPNTPFERAGMPPIAEIRRRIALVRKGLQRPGFKLSFHDPEMTCVETALGRGDRRLAKVIENVSHAGARFQAWSGTFDYLLWTEELRKEGLSWEDFTGSFDSSMKPPWNHIKNGLSQAFLCKEWENASAFIVSPDCRIKCGNCGKKCPPPPAKAEYPPRARHKPVAAEPAVRLRCEFVRSGPASMISHLETAKLIERAARRAKLPLAYSQGFHPHPKISFGPPLPLGYCSSGDYFDIIMTRNDSHIAERLNSALHGGLTIVKAVEIPLKSLAVSAIVLAYHYRIRFRENHSDIEPFRKCLAMGKKIIIPTEKGEWDISDFIISSALSDKLLELTVKVLNGRSPRPENILAVFGIDREHIESVTRKSLLPEQGV